MPKPAKYYVYGISMPHTWDCAVAESDVPLHQDFKSHVLVGILHFGGIEKINDR